MRSRISLILSSSGPLCAAPPLREAAEPPLVADPAAPTTLPEPALKKVTKDMFKFYNKIVGLTPNPTPFRLFLADKIKISQARDQHLCHLEKVIFRVLFSIDYIAPNQKTTICVPLDLKIKLPEAK